MKMLLASLILVLGVQSQAGNRLKTDVIDTAIKAGEFNTLITAVQVTGLEQALRQDGPITVFAPTDSAFAKLPEGTVDKLLADIPTLSSILTYHVVAGEPSVYSLLKNGEATTLLGQKLEFTKVKGQLIVNDSNVIKRIKVKNGQIFVIDSVLLPK